jgi:hypothetical protein
MHSWAGESNLNFDRLYLWDNTVTRPAKRSLEVCDEGVYYIDTYVGYSQSSRFLVKKQVVPKICSASVIG